MNTEPCSTGTAISTAALGTYRIADAQAAAAGAVVGRVFLTGATFGQDYHSGATAGQSHG